MTGHPPSGWPPTARVAWFAILAGPAMWALQGLAGWWIAEQTCVDGNSAWGAMPPSGVRWLQVGIAAGALAVVLLSLALGFLHWRRLDSSAAQRMEGRTRPVFLASVGLLMASVFSVALLWDLVATAILPVCEAMR